MSPSGEPLISIEICAGAGGQAIGLHRAGFRHVGLVEIDPHAVMTLRRNIAERSGWEWERKNCDVISGDVKEFNPFSDLKKWEGGPLEPRRLDLLAGGVPCPPFSHAGKQLGKDDERDLFPAMLKLVRDLQPKAVMIENVRGIMDAKFADYRTWIKSELLRAGGEGDGAGYEVVDWEVLEASNFGVPQLRPRAILVAFRKDVLVGRKFSMPRPNTVERKVTVLDALEKSMEERYAPFFEGDRAKEAKDAYTAWHAAAKNRADLRIDGSSGIAPTLVGGSRKHGGADLGPSRAKAAWRALGVSGLGVANDPDVCKEKNTADRDLFGPDGPMLTVGQAAIIQGFPEEWEFAGGKTARYRQVGNAFPPPVAHAVGEEIANLLRAAKERGETPVGREAGPAAADTRPGAEKPGEAGSQSDGTLFVLSPATDRSNDREGAGV
ncbi:DNA (cytosine-5-)-methyltransferase [Streptomyces sp.]|uniref:DNA cytosine methyltransferase n=1 Tax=Streptomyces sp. TaxID=1931 RepID=UPI002811228B|nr:DNA (cytosine-5-)-methyltransferase [Streptomyces sp.]